MRTVPISRLSRLGGSRRIPAGTLTIFALLAGVLSLTAAVQAANTANLTLDVTFTPNGAITVTLPDGTPVGSDSGSPTIIPAGYYTLLLTGPGGCSELPYFELKGPGENIQNNLDLGELTLSIVADFQPNVSYTWLDDANPDVVYTFDTSAQVLGTAPTNNASPTDKSSAGTGSTESSHDIVGASTTSRGTLLATVATTGRVTLDYRGAKVTHLAAGRYMVTVRDKSMTLGFALRRAGKKILRLTGASFVGTRSISVDLTSGTWSLLGQRSGKALDAIVVR
jgi:hypothetical protein